MRECREACSEGKHRQKNDRGGDGAFQALAPLGSPRLCLRAPERGVAACACSGLSTHISPTREIHSKFQTLVATTGQRRDGFPFLLKPFERRDSRLSTAHLHRRGLPAEEEPCGHTVRVHVQEVCEQQCCENKQGPHTGREWLCQAGGAAGLQQHQGSSGTSLRRLAGEATGAQEQTATIIRRGAGGAGGLLLFSQSKQRRWGRCRLAL